MAVWLNEKEMVEHLFGPNYHVELIKQSQFLLNFLAQERQLKSNHLDAIWAAAQVCVQIRCCMERCTLRRKSDLRISTLWKYSLKIGIKGKLWSNVANLPSEDLAVVILTLISTTKGKNEFEDMFLVYNITRVYVRECRLTFVHFFPVEAYQSLRDGFIDYTCKNHGPCIRAVLVEANCQYSYNLIHQTNIIIVFIAHTQHLDSWTERMLSWWQTCSWENIAQEITMYVLDLSSDCSLHD